MFAALHYPSQSLLPHSAVRPQHRLSQAPLDLEDHLFILSSSVLLLSFTHDWLLLFPVLSVPQLPLLEFIDLFKITHIHLHSHCSETSTILSLALHQERHSSTQCGGRVHTKVEGGLTLDFLVYRFRRNAKGIQGTERTLKKGMGGWWRDAHIYHAKTVSLRTKCAMVVSQVFSTGLNEKRWETKVMRLTFRPVKKAGKRWVEKRKRTSREMRAKWRKTMAKKNAENMWKNMATRGPGRRGSIL